MKTVDIKPYANNAKKHPKSQLLSLAKIVKEVGWRQPVLVNQKGIIVAGHGRYLTWQTYRDEYDLKPVWVIDDAGKLLMGGPETKPLTEDQEIAYRLADNKLNESPWDMELAIPDLKLLPIPMFELTGFDKDLLIEATDKDDHIPEVPIEPKSKTGDLYELGQHRLYCGDSTQKEAVLALCGGNKVDMVFTDPPYGVDYVGKTKDSLKIQNDKTTEAFKNAMPNYIENTKLGAAFYVCCPAGNKFMDFVIPFNEHCHQACTIVWVKNSLVMGHGDYHYKHEPILYGWNKNGKHKFYGDRSQTTIWEFNRPSRSAEHPTMKPVELVVNAIKNSSKEGDIILDLFGGGGEHSYCRLQNWSRMLYARD